MAPTIETCVANDSRSEGLPVQPLSGVRATASAKTVFLVGPPRSGTTLLAFLLAGGPQVLSLSEPFRLHEVFPRYGLRWIARSLRKRHNFRAGAPPQGSTDSVVLEFLREAAQHNNLRSLVIKETFRSDLAWANVALLDSFVRSGDPVIGIIRHPFDCAVSTLRMFRLWRGIVGHLTQFIVPDLPLFRGDADIAEYVAKTWNDFAEWCATREVFLIRYEDLARNPEDTLRSICVECDVAFHHCMLDHEHPRGPFAGIGDPGVMTRKARPVSVRSVGRKKQLPRVLREILVRRCSEHARRFDYSL